MDPVVSAAADALRGHARAAGRDLRKSRLLAAVSGGVDSMVLLDVLAELARAPDGPIVAVGHVHHGLRGAEADADEAAVRAAAEARGLPFGVERVDPKAAVAAATTSRDRPTTQEAARALRYAALRRLARRLLGPGPEVAIATAHTLDDQAETVLLRLLRGAGPSGLAGIPPRSPEGDVVRPLLDVERAAIERHARARGIVWRDDASNEDRRYARNRLRHDWLPGLAREFNPRLLNTLARVAEAHRRDAEWIDGLVADALRARCAWSEAGEAEIDLSGWDELPEALALRLWRQILIAAGAGRHLEARHLERLQAFARTGRTGAVLELPGGFQARRRRAKLVLARASG